MLSQKETGNLIQADFFNLLGGLNNTDSPFKVAQEQAIAGYNYDYVSTGGIKKRKAHTLLNASADAQTNTLGIFVHSTSAASTKTVLRAAGTKLQTINQTTGASTNVTSDATGASTTAFSSTQPVVFSQFNTSSADTTWMAGGGVGSAVLLGYNGTTFTTNGTAIPTSSGMSSTTVAGTQLLTTGTYYYAIAFVKNSTAAASNAACDLSVSVTSGGSNVVRLTFNITNNDTTKYSGIRVYRSAISGTSLFTAGNLIATVASSATTYDDTGATAASASDNVPRAGNTSLDNSVLGSGTYNSVTTWKRRLVTATGSTVLFSDLNKPESWPTANTITLPSGGDIKAVGVIYFSTPTTSATDEILVVFKEREMWVVTGSNFVRLTNGSGVITQDIDITLKFIDYVGCVAQNLIVFAKGFLYWIDYSGVYLWDGSAKPVYLSRLIEYDFSLDGDLDLTSLMYGCGDYLRRQNQIIWFLPSLSLGVNKLALKLDLRLTLGNSSFPNSLVGRVLDAVFMKDSLTYNMYGVKSALISSSEVFYGSGNDGRIWELFDNENSENSAAVAFSYRTKSEDFGLAGVAKRFHKVIVWCRESTTNNLTLKYWTNYKLNSSYQTTLNVVVSNQVTNAVWDQATWDSAYWDENLVTFRPVVFNLSGAEGDSITLEMDQGSVNSPITIAGYSVFYTQVGLRK